MGNYQHIFPTIIARTSNKNVFFSNLRYIYNLINAVVSSASTIKATVRRTTIYNNGLVRLYKAAN